jgi:transposase
MEVLYSRCAGLDVHKKRVTACILITEGGKRPSKEIQSFGTMLEDLEQMAT